MEDEMIDRKLFWWIILPLALVVALAFWINWPIDFCTLLMDLSVEIVGIIITLAFVDWLLSKREKERWLIADTLIGGDFGGSAMRFIAHITLLLSKGGWMPNRELSKPTSEKPWGFNVENISAEEILPALRMATQEDWLDFSNAIEDRLADIQGLVTRYMPRLSAEKARVLLSYEGSLLQLRSDFQVISNEETLLRLAETSSQDINDLTEKLLERTSENVAEAIEASIEISRVVAFLE